jgi:MFS family permease
MVTAMLPELATGLHTSLATAATALTAYMVPFAALMLVSGTLAEHWGRARTVRYAYGAYALACLLCALAPTATVFLGARALQGAANAFTTPLLVAALSDLVPGERIGRALGVFGGMQGAGQAFSPLVGGAAAAVDYRWAFVVAAGAAALLAVLPPPDRPAPAGRTVAAGSRWRSLATRRLALACAVAFGLYLAGSGLTLLTALLAFDRFGLGPEQRGLVIASFGVAGLLTGARLGHLADRFGIRRFGIVVALVLAVDVLLAGRVPSVALLVAAVAVAGAASTAGRLTSNALAVTSTPTNRGGAASMTLAWQFLGSAITPLTVLPLYHRDVDLGFAGAACGGVAAAALLATAPRLQRRVSREATPPARP